MQATVGGLAIALGGAVRDTVSSLATHGALGDVLASPATGYSFVYHLELYLMFATLVAIGPLVPGTPHPQAAGQVWTGGVSWLMRQPCHAADFSC